MLHQNSFGDGIFSRSRTVRALSSITLLVFVAGSVSSQTITGGFPSAPTFSGTVTAPSLSLSGITGSTQCLQASTIGLISGTGSPCGSGGGSMMYPGAGIPNSTGAAWGTSYSVSGTGPVALTTSPTLITPNLGTPSALTLTNATGLPNTSVIGLGTFATQNYASPPAIGGTTPAAGSFSSLTDTGVTGSTQCLQASTAGVISGTGAACGGSGAAPGGSSGQVQYNNAGAFGGASGATISGGVMTLTTPILGAATATSINGDTLTTGSWTLSGAASKTLTFNNSITFAGTDATTMTLPSTSATLARTDAAQTFLGLQTLSNGITTPSNISLTAAGAVRFDGFITQSATMPTISSGFGTSPAISATVGTSTFNVTVGTGGTASTGVITMPAATNGWNCQINDQTTKSASVAFTMETANTTTSVTVGNFTDVMATGPWNAGDVLQFVCMGR
jgi:hypothetical protein